MKDIVTPIRKQYLKIKRKYPQAIVFFRLGDFYETFDEDARITSKELEIVLTAREMGKGNKVPLAGIPYHAIDNYLAKLINRGYKVAICEQVTKPGETKGLVEREVVRVVTPGTVVEPGLLDSHKNNYLTSVVLGPEEAGIAYVDITTSEFTTIQLPRQRVLAELERLNPSEIIVAESLDHAGMITGIPVTRLDDYWFEADITRQTLLDHFRSTTLEGFGCAGLPLAIRAAGAIVHYIEETQKGALKHLNRLSTYSTDSFMALDIQTQNNLEIFRSSTGTANGSLLSVIDLTRTSMGSRLIRKWLSQPLLDKDELLKRQDAIQWFYDCTLTRNQVITLLGKMADLERLINRVSSNIITPRELIALKRSLEIVPRIKEAIDGESRSDPVKWLKDNLKPRHDVITLIDNAIVDDPSTSPGEGGVIRPGFSEELDKLKLVSSDARQYLANMERFEQQNTGIKSLKIRYNKVFGYYIEVSKANIPQVPEHYIRKQTLVNNERYFTPELKEYESLILNAHERINSIETDIYSRICRQIADTGEQILGLARILANMDVFSSLAEVAVRYRYVRPELVDKNDISITQGRHPVVEQALTDSDFIPNDSHLSNDEDQLIILTGPNMAGKSTYLKQVALIVLLAQIGSFVPADSASIGLVDRIFTRIGAREDLISGQSTFMIEMVETANILNNATPRSLLILDEIGRGTSTYDGLSIARAVAEYIHNHPRLGARTLFATHYHEMVELADYLPRVKNYNVAVKEEKGEVIFLRKIVQGGVDKSYGIHVAKLAGLPRNVVHRAREILDDLEDNDHKTPGKPSGRKSKAQKQEIVQISLFGQKPPVLEELEKVDIDSLTPLEALNKLYELQKKAKEG